MAQLRPCIEKIELPQKLKDYIISQREIHAKKGLSESAADLLTAKELQEKILDEVHNVYNRLGVKGYENAIEYKGESAAVKTDVLDKRSNEDIEKRMVEIEGDKKYSAEFNLLEKEMDKRERGSVFDVPLSKVNDAIDILIKKEKEKPNGYGSFIESRDARETKEVANRYLNAKKLTDAELKKDFSDAVRGNPATWYADGLKMREALKEATSRGIDTNEMLAEVTKAYTDAGYDIETAKIVVANMLKPIFEGSKKVNEKQISELPETEIPITPKEESPPSEPPIEAGEAAAGGEQTGIKREATEEIRKKFDLSKYEGEKWTREQLEVAADEAIKKGYNPEILIKQMEGGVPPTGVENFILKKYLATLEAAVEKDPSDANIAAVERLINATDAIGTLQSKAFASRKGLIDIEDSLAGYFVREKEINKEAPLTEKQKETVKKEYDEISETQKKYDEKIAQLEAENTKLKAEAEIRNLPKVKKENKTSEDYKKERQSLKDKLKQQIQEYKESGQKLGISSDGGAQQFVISAKMAKTVMEIVKSHVEEIGNDLKEVTKRTLEEVKDLMTGISEKDIQDIIVGKYAEKKKPKNELAANLFDMKQQLKLVGELERLEARIPKTEKETRKRNQDLEALRKKIKEHDVTKLEAYKERTKKQIAEVEDKINKGDFERTKPREKIKLDKEAQELQDKLIKVKNERELRILREEYANRSGYQKASDNVAAVLNIPRSLMSTLDYSALLRQAAIPVIANPKMAFGIQMENGKPKFTGAAYEMIKAGASQKVYDRWFYELENSPRYETMQDSKLAISESTSPDISAREEQFMSNLADKIPVIGKTLIKGSERAYSMLLNKIRADLFNRFADAMEERGLTFENSPEQYKQMAAYINNSTGRGDLGNWLNNAAPILNSLFFSPRLIASRLNMLTYLAQPRFYKSVPREVRIDYFKSMAKFIGLGLTVISLAALNKDNDVETDPRSSDFGKIKNKNTRWDVWAGFQQYIRAGVQMLIGERKSTRTGLVQNLDGSGMFGENRGTVGMNFMRGKLAPVPAMAIDLFSGRTITGNKVKFQWDSDKENKEVGMAQYMFEHLLPLTATGLGEAVKDQGVKGLFTVGVPSVFGVGTQTYEPEEPSKKDAKRKKKQHRQRRVEK